MWLSEVRETRCGLSCLVADGCCEHAEDVASWAAGCDRVLPCGGILEVERLVKLDRALFGPKSAVGFRGASIVGSSSL
jgi:hypothetical protein